MRRWHFLVLLAAAMAAGCSALTPFPTGPLEAKPGAKDGSLRVAVCYNTFKTPAEKVQEVAQTQCFGDSVARLVDTDYRMDNCPVMTPGRATFVCAPK